ncbi:uncharacterized protein EV420DRAFT_1654109 [Desarmillaria tabescens]|uniref:Uncharacterized protein n=1 Tax=Armillaria tabescens TaxID=1929756 RepID=A0AA39MH98_ARMTA|nr:uncharacterized protein EV420DRAFT_1654109 [Desarmillaria tabescens]KAK0434252.1 hypothetical protein EV420DRAFT_1654109 [Desarmillaria tabescens]
MAPSLFVVVVKTHDDLRKLQLLLAVCLVGLIRDASWKRDALQLILKTCENQETTVQQLNWRLDGTHPLYRYQSGIAEIASDRSSILYRSLLATMDKFCQQLGQPSPLSRLNSDPTCLFLDLPGNWQESHDMCDFQPYVLNQEMFLRSHCGPPEITSSVLNLSLENWPISLVSFFFNLFPNLLCVTIQGCQCLLKNIPVIRYLYLLPPTIKHLALRKVAFEEHALETMLSLGTTLESLSLIDVFKGYVPTNMDRRAWQERWGVANILQPEIYLPVPASLQRLVLHSPRADALPGVHPSSQECRDDKQVLQDFAYLVSQLFGVGQAAEGIQHLLEPSELFPRRLGMGCLTVLDLAFAMCHFELLGGILEVVADTLRTLSFRYSGQAAMAACQGYPVHVLLGSLQHLEHLTLFCPADALSLALLCIQTWDCPEKMSPSSSLMLVGHLLPGLETSLLEYLSISALQCALLGSVSAGENPTECTTPFKGRFLLSLRAFFPYIISSVDLDHTSVVLDSLYHCEDVEAKILPCLAQVLHDADF